MRAERYYAERIARAEISRAWSEGIYAHTYYDSDVIVYRLDLGSRNQIASTVEKYLKLLSDGKRDALMAYKGNEAFKQGNDWRGILNNWKGHENPNPRLKRSDFELNKKVIAGKELPIKNDPNSILDLRDKSGIINKRRLYDVNGDAKLDVDFSFHGNSRHHPIKLHVHDWLPGKKHQLGRLLTESKKKLIKDLWGDDDKTG